MQNAYFYSREVTLILQRKTVFLLCCSFEKNSVPSQLHYYLTATKSLNEQPILRPLFGSYRIFWLE